jgi:hypothetical protein
MARPNLDKWLDLPPQLGPRNDEFSLGFGWCSARLDVRKAPLINEPKKKLKKPTYPHFLMDLRFFTSHVKRVIFLDYRHVHYGEICHWIIIIFSPRTLSLTH